MLKLLKYYPVNWIDGMKLNRQHFMLTEAAMLDAVRDASNLQLNGWNFGLLSGLQGPASSLEYTIDVDRAGLVRINLRTCRAITPAGARIEVVNIPNQRLHASIGELNAEFSFLNHTGKQLFVVVSVNPFERAPFGDPDPGEHPPRYPLTIPQYNLEILPEDQFTEIGPFHLPIAKLMVQASGVQIVDNYIPPATAMGCHAALDKLQDEFELFFSQMELHCGQILQKIYQKQQKNPLAEMAQYLVERMIGMLGEQVHAQRWMDRDMPPVQAISRIASLARIMKNGLEVRSGAGREEFINYLTDWDEFNLQQGEFESHLNELVLLGYNHLDIAASVTRCRRFTATLLQVFSKLAKLDYIGKKEDPGIIVAQRTAQDAAKKSGSGKGSSIWLE